MIYLEIPDVFARGGRFPVVARIGIPPKGQTIRNKTGTFLPEVLYVDNRDAFGWTLGKAAPLSV
jgi:hypothetical protein